MNAPASIASAHSLAQPRLLAFPSSGSSDRGQRFVDEAPSFRALISSSFAESTSIGLPAPCTYARILVSSDAAAVVPYRE